MTKLLDEIKKAIRADIKGKQKLDEAEFKSDDGISTVPDVAFDTSLPKTDIGATRVRDTNSVAADNAKITAKKNKFTMTQKGVKDLADKDVEDVLPHPGGGPNVTNVSEDEVAEGDTIAEDDDKSDFQFKSKDSEAAEIEDEAPKGKKKTAKKGSDDDSDKDDDKDDADKKHVTVTVDEEFTEFLKSAKVTNEDVDVTEDLAAIFGEDTKLSETFRKRTKTVFEAAVVAKVNQVLQQIVAEVAADYEQEKTRLSESMVDKIDAYLDKVVTEWMEANQPAVESQLRTQVSESFMDGLKNLLETHYIDVPQDKEQVFESLIEENAEQASQLDREINENVKLRKQIADMRKNSLIAESVKGLSENQVEKLKQLAEAVDYDNDEQFTDKLEELTEAYFSKRQVVRPVDNDKQPVQLTEEVVDRRSDEIKYTMESIGRFLRK